VTLLGHSIYLSGSAIYLSFLSFVLFTHLLVWCRAACGQNVHKGCFETWAATKKMTMDARSSTFEDEAEIEQDQGSVQGEGETRGHQRRSVRMPSCRCCHFSHRFHSRAIYAIDYQTSHPSTEKNRVGAITFPDSTNIVDIVDITTIELLSVQRPGATAEGPTDERQSEKKRRITSQPLDAQFVSSKLTADMQSLMADSSRAGRTSQFRG
jgi:hypothetical protein